MESTRPATEMAARSAIVYLETRPGRFKLHNFVIFSSVEPTFLHQLHQLRQLLAHPLSTRSRSGRVTSFLGGSSGGRQAIGHVAAVSTASSAAGHHIIHLTIKRNTNRVYLHVGRELSIRFSYNSPDIFQMSRDQPSWSSIKSETLFLVPV